MVSNDLQNKIQRFLAESFRLTLRYFKVKILISLILAVAAGGIFSLLEMPKYGLFAAIFGLTNLVPIIGPWLGAAAICLVLLFLEPILALYALFTVLGLQIVDQFILSPLLMGRAVELKPLMVLGVLLVAGAFTGFWGLVFAVPLAACLKLGYDIFFLNKPPD